jgi:hypothetical protein
MDSINLECIPRNDIAEDLELLRLYVASTSYSSWPSSTQANACYSGCPEGEAWYETVYLVRGTMVYVGCIRARVLPS